MESAREVGSFGWMWDSISLAEMRVQLPQSWRALGWSQVLRSVEKWVDVADSSPTSSLRSQKIAQALLLLTNLFLEKGAATTPVDLFKSLLFRSRWSSVPEVKEAAFECCARLVEHGVAWANVKQSDTTYRQPEPYLPGQCVVTTRDAGATDWSTEARVHVRWGVEGVVEGWSDSHGLVYFVRHKDETMASYEARELRTSEMAIRTATFDGERVIAKHGSPHANIYVVGTPEGWQATVVLQKAEAKLNVMLTPEQTKEFAADLLRSVDEDPEHAVRELRRQCEDLESTLSEVAFFSKALGNGSLTEIALAWEGLSSHERREAIMKRIEYLAELADATRRRNLDPSPLLQGWQSFPRQIDVSDVPTEDLPRMLGRLCGISKRDVLAFLESVRVGHSCLALTSPMEVRRLKQGDLFVVLEGQWGLWLRTAKDHVRWDVSVRV